MMMNKFAGKTQSFWETQTEEDSKRKIGEIFPFALLQDDFISWILLSYNSFRIRQFM